MSDTAVWFDLDGTLLRYEREFDRMVSDALVAGGLRTVPDAAPSAFAEHVFGVLERGEDDPFETTFAAIAADLDLEFDPEAAAEAYLEIELEATTVAADARETVTAAAERGPVGLLANGPGELEREKLEHHGLADLFDAVVFSGEVGVRKPDPEIFAMAEERLDAARHVHVGDEYETDVAPATNAGWEAIHVRNDQGPAVSVDEVGSLRSLFL